MHSSDTCLTHRVLPSVPVARNRVSAPVIGRHATAHHMRDTGPFLQLFTSLPARGVERQWPDGHTVTNSGHVTKAARLAPRLRPSLMVTIRTVGAEIGCPADVANRSQGGSDLASCAGECWQVLQHIAADRTVYTG